MTMTTITMEKAWAASGTGMMIDEKKGLFDVGRGISPLLQSVMAGLDPAIHDFPAKKSGGKAWMPGTRPGMTECLAGFSADPNALTPTAP
ncbi:MAG: hypothetical protein HQL45_11025 [Alphaproteobacteria bacterium]|nr:hypothetical protein [Alphaproteobacteria bacterium]